MNLTKIAVDQKCEYKPSHDGTFYFVTQVDELVATLRAELATANEREAALEVENAALNVEIATLESEITFQAGIITKMLTDKERSE